MSIEGGPQSVEKEKFIGNVPFGFTLESIQEVFCKFKEELLEAEKILVLHEDKTKVINRVPELVISRNKPILAVPPEEILQSLREIYNFIISLEKEGLSKEDITLKIKNENKNMLEMIQKYYAILRDQDWSYRLWQNFL